MPHKLEPEVGAWYRDQDNDLYFTVVAIDTDAGSVELQHFDGDIEEFDVAEWPLHNLEAAAEPADWTGPLDNVDSENWDDEVKPEDLRAQAVVSGITGE